MVQLTLPKNSKVTEGKTWPHRAKAGAEREYRVYRWDPEDDRNPRIDTYYVDTADCGPMILNTLIWMKNNSHWRITARRTPNPCVIWTSARNASCGMNGSRPRSTISRIFLCPNEAMLMAMTSGFACFRSCR